MALWALQNTSKNSYFLVGFSSFYAFNFLSLSIYHINGKFSRPVLLSWLCLLGVSGLNNNLVNCIKMCLSLDFKKTYLFSLLGPIRCFCARHIWSPRWPRQIIGSEPMSRKTKKERIHNFIWLNSWTHQICIE